MRPLPEKRSRRLGDNQHQKVANIKRLINGLSTTHSVTTRSQAKVTKKAKPLKKKLSPTPVKSTGSSKLHNGTGGSSRVNGLLQRGSSGQFLGRGGASSKDNSRRRAAAAKLLNGYGKNNRHLVILGDHLSNGSLRSSATAAGEKEAPKNEADRLALQRATAAERRAERLKKRRSALWVLNCEAESFLFGETAADKHEVELPPMSTPAKKRRMRTNELGTLLKESPILSSKLRSPPLSASKDEEAANNATTATIADRKPQVSTAGMASLRDGTVDEERRREDPSSSKVSPVQNELSSFGPFHPYRNNLLIPSPFKSISECNSNPDSVRLQNILSSMDWRFSFEERPSGEAWYKTFERQENRQSSVAQVPSPSTHPWTPTLLLPYETKVYNSIRSPMKKKLSKLPRKSPRCHASTLAILSSLKRGRYRNSLLGPLSPGMPSNNELLLQQSTSSAAVPTTGSSEVTSTEEKPKRTYKKRTVAPPQRSPSLELSAPSPSKTSKLPPVSPPLLTLCSPSSASLSSSPSSPSSPHRMKDLSATQYLWDSIQLLSDPYVIQVLAEERSTSPNPLKTSGSSSSNNLCSSHVKGESSSSAAKGAKGGAQKKEANNAVLTAERIRIPSGGTNPSRSLSHVKISANSLPPHVNGSANNNNNTEYILSFDSSKRPISISSGGGKKNLCKASSASSSVSSSDGNNSDHTNNELKLNVEISCGEKGGNGLSNASYRNVRKVSRKSPVVLVSDIFKSGTLKVNSTTVNLQSQKAVISSSASSEGSSVVNCDGNHNTVNSSSYKTGSKEDLLFRVEGLPPLPAWPV